MLLTLSAPQESRRDSPHQNKVKVKGVGRKSSYLAGFSFFFFLGSMKKFNQLAKKKKRKKIIKIFVSTIKTKVPVAIKFPKKKKKKKKDRKSAWRLSGPKNQHF